MSQQACYLIGMLPTKQQFSLYLYRIVINIARMLTWEVRFQGKIGDPCKSSQTGQLFGQRLHFSLQNYYNISIFLFYPLASVSNVNKL